MEENIEIKEKVSKATIPEDTLIPVKFNKEIKNVPLKEATALIQKGMKYDSVSGEYSRLKNLAASSGKAVGDYITFLENEERDRRYRSLLEECGGNEQTANRILELEGNKKDDLPDMSEIKEFFPEIKDIDSIPKEVLENIELSGGNLLNSYLRYLLKAEREKQKILQERENAANSSAGSQSKNESLSIDAAANQFLKGIWGR